MSEYTDLRAKYIRLAKRADQRLVRLEQYSELPFYKGITAYSYADAVKAIAKVNPGGKRFNAKIPKTEAGLRNQIKAMEKFLAAPTSTKRGINSVYAKRAKTLNQTLGTNFTWQQLAVFFDSGLAVKMDAKLGSKTMLQTIHKMALKKGEILRAIKESNEKDLRIDDNDAVNKKIIDLVSKNNIEFEQMLRDIDRNAQLKKKQKDLRLKMRDYYNS